MKVGENMCQITLNSHAKFHGDQTIGGAITFKIALKTLYLYINDLTLLSMFIIHIKHEIFISYVIYPHSEQLCLLD